jgi:hypothetical protein
MKDEGFLTAKRSPLLWGSQMCLNGGDSHFFMKQKFNCYSVVIFFLDLLVMYSKSMGLFYILCNIGKLQGLMS